jgi:hypothetical protein
LNERKALWFVVCYSPFSIFEVTIFMNEIITMIVHYKTSISFNFVAMTCNFFVYYFCNSLFREFLNSMNLSCCKKQVNNNNQVNVLRDYTLKLKICEKKLPFRFENLF